MPGNRTSLLPTTKVGSNEKERAYVVRQNLCMKLILAVAAILLVLASLLFCSMYEVRVQRRGMVHEAKEHREEEHATHMRIMQLSMLLQQRLEDEVHDMSILTAYRAGLLKAVGQFQTSVVRNCSLVQAEQLQLQQQRAAGGEGEGGGKEEAPLTTAMRRAGTAFDRQIDGLLKQVASPQHTHCSLPPGPLCLMEPVRPAQLWDDLVSEGQAAQGQLHNISAAIISELRQDAEEASQFDELMATWGQRSPGYEYKYDEERHEFDEESRVGEALERCRAPRRARRPKLTRAVHVAGSTPP